MLEKYNIMNFDENTFFNASFFYIYIYYYRVGIEKKNRKTISLKYYICKGICYRRMDIRVCNDRRATLSNRNVVYRKKLYKNYLKTYRISCFKSTEFYNTLHVRWSYLFSNDFFFKLLFYLFIFGGVMCIIYELMNTNMNSINLSAKFYLVL